jgi:hypothetical protein
MKNNTLLNEEQALGSDELLKVTALLYFKEALVAQQYETCQELIGTAKNLGVNPGDISAVIADYLKNPSILGKNTDAPKKQGTCRLRSLKGEL